MRASVLTPVLSSQLVVGTDEKGQDISIHYELYRAGISPETAQKPQALSLAAPPGSLTTRVLFIMGFAADLTAWHPLLVQLQRLWNHHAGEYLEALLIDNRGIGGSSCPEAPSNYSTILMARDALDVLDHVKWGKVHVVGFSMGGMIATKLASMQPHRIESMTILSTSEGGASSLPTSWKGIKAFIKGVLCLKTPEERAHFDLKLHFSKHTLRHMVPGLGRTVREVLYDEYVENGKAGKPQPDCAFKGQGIAVLKHDVSDSDVANIKGGHFPVWLLHGRHDVVASYAVAERLAARLGAPCVLLDGAHMIAREKAVEVALLLRMILANSDSKLDPSRSVTLRRPAIDGLALNLEGATQGAPVLPPPHSDDPSSALMTAMSASRQKLN